MTAASSVPPAYRVEDVTGTAVLSVLVLAIAVLFAGANRPIWIDEFLHFAFASYGSTADAWSAIVRSLVNVNFNQTGIYMLLDFWLLKLFGASAFWLRMPSLAGMLLLFAAAISILRARGFHVLWQIILVLLLVRQTWLMQFVAEARPYMLLAATCVGVLACYVSSPRETGMVGTAIGWLSITIGAAIHPYFLPYYLLIVVVTYGDAVAWDPRRISLISIWTHMRPAMFGVALCVYFGVGLLTWMPRQPELALDPFQWIPKDALIEWGIFCHFEFLFGTSRPPVPFLISAAMLIVAFVAWLGVTRPRYRSLWTPLALLLGALAVSALLSLMSYRAHYWILPRQWVASYALACIGMVWFCAGSVEHLSRNARLAVVGVALTFAVVRAEQAVVMRLAVISTWRAEQLLLEKVSPDFVAREHVDDRSRDGAEWVALANQNIIAGGSVWPIFRRYYTDVFEAAARK